MTRTPTSPPSSPVRASRTLNADAGSAEVVQAPRLLALLPADLVADDEIIILMIRPSVLFIPLSCGVSLLVFAFLASLLAWLSHYSSLVGWTDTQAFALGLGLAVLRLGWQSLEWYSRVYVLTDRRVIRRFGVVRVNVFQTQLKHIQHTSVFVSIRERVAGLGTLGFATSGSHTFEAFWVMVRKPFVVHRTVLEAIQRYGRR